MASKKPPVIFLELVEKRSSGFVKQGTEGTMFHEELNCPNISWIPNRGMAAEKVIETVAGKEVETTVYKEVRWIKNCNTIDLTEQEKRNIKPNYFEDKIPFEKGFATVVRDGGTISLYDYLLTAFYNKSNPDRPSTAEGIYKVVQLDKQAEQINEADVEMADAIKLVDSLRTKTGSKDTPYKYNEERISAMCAVCQVHAETPAQQLYALMSLAKARPRWFLDLVVKFEQTVLTEVSHALELKVIQFDGNTAMYSEGNKVIRNFGAGNFKHEKKIELLADYLKTQEGNPDLTELRAKTDLAKEKALKN